MVGLLQDSMFWGKGVELSFGHAKFEMLIKYLT